MLTMVVDLTEHSLLFTCCECTAEQGPSHSIPGHDYSRLGCDPMRAGIPFNGANPSYVRFVVETTGIEPATLCVQGRCSSQLSYIPV